VSEKILKPKEKQALVYKAGYLLYNGSASFL